MAHKISNQNGIDECFTAGQPAWHGLGANVDKAQRWKEAYKLAHLDWKVDKFRLEHNGKPVDAFGLFRSDNGKFINAVGSQFNPFQNEDCFTWVDTLLDRKNGAHYVTAGALGNGEIVWCLAKLPEVIGIKGTQDESHNYLLFVDYRVQGKAAINKLTSTRVVCNNTLNVALREKGALMKIRHNENFESRLEDAKEVLSSVRGDIQTLDSKLNFLASRKMTKHSMTTIMEHIFPNIRESVIMQNRAETVLEIYDNNDNDAIPEIRGSAYNLVNAITNYVDHVQNVSIKGQDGKDGKGIQVQVREQKRAESAMFGSGSQFKTEALEYILETVEHNPSMPKGIGDKTIDNIANLMDMSIPSEVN